MSYLAPEFDPDIFVSYSHGDSVGGRAMLRDWTQALIERLHAQLRSLETEFRDLRLWMDPEIDPTAKLTEELRGTVVASGVLMIVMSKHYLDSSWCGDELKWFQEQIEGRAGGDAGRVFVLRAQETDTSLWPAFLRDERGHPMPGFSFYDSTSGYPWNYPDLKEPSAELCKELIRLQTWLIKRLRKMRERAHYAQAAAAAPPQSVGPRLIYLHTPPETEQARADIYAALTGDGIIPLSASSISGRGLPDWQHETTKRIEIAKNCEALALLRVGDASRFVRDLLCIGVEERKGISVRGAPMPCAVLDTTGEGLPIDGALFGIERFDINHVGWPGKFRHWLEAAVAPSEGAAL